jgi:hypothetical protein
LPSSPLTSGTSCLQTRAWGRSRECTGIWWGLVEFGSTSSGPGSWRENFACIFVEWRWFGREWSLFVFRATHRSGVCLLEVSLRTLWVPFLVLPCFVRCSCRQCFWWRWGCRFLVRMSDVLSSLATPPILIALSR